MPRWLLLTLIILGEVVALAVFALSRHFYGVWGVVAFLVAIAIPFGIYRYRYGYFPGDEEWAALTASERKKRYLRLLPGLAVMIGIIAVLLLL